MVGVVVTGVVGVAEVGAVDVLGVLMPAPVVPGGVVETTGTVQSIVLEEPAGVDIEVPRNPVVSAIGLPLVLESPAYTRTTMRFMLAKLVSK